MTSIEKKDIAPGTGKTIAVLAVQGAFMEHEKMLQSLGAEVIELRQKSDLFQPFDGLVLPGGESTVQGKLLRELDMFEELQEKIAGGLPVLATCAGLILLAENIENDERRYFQTLPVTVKRNAYGRQLGSFYHEGTLLLTESVTYPMEFIRAPYISNLIAGEEEVKVLAKVDDHIVAVQYHNQLAMAFHPELTCDSRIHEYFCRMMDETVK